MGEGSRTRSKIRRSQSTAISPLVPRSSDLFRMSPARTLVSPVLCSAALGEGVMNCSPTLSAAVAD